MAIKRIAVAVVGGICALCMVAAVAVAAIPAQVCACVGGMGEPDAYPEALEE